MAVNPCFYFVTEVVQQHRPNQAVERVHRDLVCMGRGRPSNSVSLQSALLELMRMQSFR